MTATTSTIPTTTVDNSASTATVTRPASLRRTTLAYGLGVAGLITAGAAALHAAGVSFAIDGKMIPLAGFAQMTFLGALVGGVLLAVLNRRSHAPRRRFIQSAVVLTALSCAPSVGMPPEIATKVALVALHLLAAVIIVPALARHATH